MTRITRIASAILSLLVSIRLFIFAPAAEVKVYRSVPNTEKKIALTFDDGPHPSLTIRILEILARYDAKATFFMVGENVVNYPDAAKAVLDAGHEVGNHTYSHPHVADLNACGILEEIGKCEDVLEELCEYRPHLLRPPQGAMHPCFEDCLEREDYLPILWSLDTRDWEEKSTDRIVRSVLDEVHPGDIILMHDYIGHNSKTPEALEKILPELRSRGYEFVTVSALLGIQ